MRDDSTDDEVEEQGKKLRTQEPSKKEADRSPVAGKESSKATSGTTLRVYRLLYSEGRPLGTNEVQRKANLSSVSLAYYHLNKLVEQGLATQKDGGYLVDRIVFENMIRIKRSVIPLQVTFAAFFGAMIVGLVLFLRPHSGSFYFSSIFLFGLVTNCVAFGIFAYQTIATVRQYRV